MSSLTITFDVIFVYFSKALSVNLFCSFLDQSIFMVVQKQNLDFKIET